MKAIGAALGCVAVTYILVGSLFAGAEETRSRSPCKDYDKLIAEYSTLRFTNRADRERGYQDLPGVDQCLNEFGDGDQGDASARFPPIVQLAAAALPFDEESGVAESISNLIADQRLERIYTNTLAEITDRCHRAFFSAMVSAYSTCPEDERGMDSRACRIARAKADRAAECLGERQ